MTSGSFTHPDPEAVARRSMPVHPRLAELMAEFERGDFSYMGPYDDDERVAVARLREREVAKSQCNNASRDFLSLLRENQVSARNVMLRRAPGDTSFADYGYDDFPSGGHVITLVEVDDTTYSVDWTANQYGPQETFPLVRQQTSQGWQQVG